MTVQRVSGGDVEMTFQAERIIAGHCPACHTPMVVFNNHGVWPLLECGCGWRGGTLDIDNHVRIAKHE